MLVKTWIDNASQQLKEAGISSARLDAEMILSHTLMKGRTYLHAHGDDSIDSYQRDIADARLQLRIERTPVAYIVGHKEFYGRQFKVTPATLVPRPESETIITMLKNLATETPTSEYLVDVGAGSGCLGITAKLELPRLHVTLLDLSRHALGVAQKNTQKLQAEVEIIQSDLLDSYPFQAQYIVANLPYVDPAWERSPETQYEPDIALFAKEDGLRLIKKLIVQAPSRLASNGYLILEADPRQHASTITFAQQYGFQHIQTKDFIICLRLTSVRS